MDMPGADARIDVVAAADVAADEQSMVLPA